MRISMKSACLALALLSCVFTGLTSAQTKPAGPAGRASGWTDVDERLVFFTVQLASVETSIDATNKQLKAAGYKISVRLDDAARFQKGNELMDRNAGGPTRWQDFYGRTAESFFYNPAPRPGELRLTATVLRSNGAESMPKPADQRPPQFDYIYRANDQARDQAEADIARLAGKVDQLLARRRQLESEQNGLWTKIAFRAIAGRELLGRPLYRFDLKTESTDAKAAQQLEAMRAAMDFLRISNRLVELADRGVDMNLDGFVQVFEDNVLKSRADFDTRVMKQPSLVMDAGERSTTLGKLSAVAKRMNDVAKNVGDAYKWSLDGDKAGDEQRMQTFRAQLQESLITYAEAVAAGDECVTALAKEWKIMPDLDKMIDLPKAPEIPEPVTAKPAVESSPVANTAKQPVDEKPKQASIAGDWLLSSVTNFRRPVTLREDGTVGRTDGFKGRWSLRGETLVIDYGDIVDTFPKRDGEAWVGKNSEGTQIRLDRANNRREVR